MHVRAYIRCDVNARKLVSHACTMAVKTIHQRGGREGYILRNEVRQTQSCGARHHKMQDLSCKIPCRAMSLCCSCAQGPASCPIIMLAIYVSVYARHVHCCVNDDVTDFYRCPLSYVNWTFVICRASRDIVYVDSSNTTRLHHFIIISSFGKTFAHHH